MTDELVQVWRQRDGSWRWRYVVLDHTELRSNRGYGSVEEAIRSARQAYPEVVILGPVDHVGPGEAQTRRSSGLVRVALVSASTVLLAMAAWYALRRRRGAVRRARGSRRRGR